ncbi:MAG: response regulator transcription factor [Thermomicrobiales bacterium]
MTHTPIRLLLVDDHAAFRQPLAFMLEREPDFTVIAQANSLTEARRLPDEIRSQVDVAIVDLQLPDGDGTDIIREMRASNSPGQALVLTADTDKLASCPRRRGGGGRRTREIDSTAGGRFTAIRRASAGESVQSSNEVMELVRLASEKRDRDLATGPCRTGAAGAPGARGAGAWGSITKQSRTGVHQSGNCAHARGQTAGQIECRGVSVSRPRHLRHSAWDRSP